MLDQRAVQQPPQPPLHLETPRGLHLGVRGVRERGEQVLPGVLGTGSDHQAHEGGDPGDAVAQAAVAGVVSLGAGVVLDGARGEPRQRGVAAHALLQGVDVVGAPLHPAGEVRRFRGGRRRWPEGGGGGFGRGVRERAAVGEGEDDEDAAAGEALVELLELLDGEAVEVEEAPGEDDEVDLVLRLLDEALHQVDLVARDLGEGEGRGGVDDHQVLPQAVDDELVHAGEQGGRGEVLAEQQLDEGGFP